MGKVKTALEIALEKAGRLGELSEGEKEKIREEQRIASLLSDFYQARIDANALWMKFKGTPATGLVSAQVCLIDTIGLQMIEEELQRRKDAILAIETLKQSPNTAAIESSLNAIGELQKEYDVMRKQAVDDLRRQMEEHPQLRMVPVKRPDGKTVMQMGVSVDEAVKGRIEEYLAEQEESFGNEFTFLITELKGLVET
jgi:hypothetical protein